MALKVIIDYIPIGHPNRPGIKLYSQDARIWHGTANFNLTADDVMHRRYVGRDYIKKWNAYLKKYEFFEADGKTPFRYGAAHNYIDKDSVTIMIPHDEYVPGAGDRPNNYENGFKGQTRIARDVFNYQQNYRSVQSELCMNDMDSWHQVLQNAIEFTRLYMHHIKEDYRHFDVTGKVCPSPLVNLSIKETDPRWLDFIKRIDQAVNVPVYPKDTPLIRINGEIINKDMEVQPFKMNGMVMVPVRFISEKLGKKVTWISKENIVDIN